MKKRTLLILFLPFLIILFLVFSLFTIRFFSERQIDDVSPGIPCSQELLKKPDVLFVIPKFENESINKSWCESILALNKKLGLHGVYHTYNEFLEDRDEAYLQQGINIFKDCFGFYPKDFKAPQLAISENNKRMIKNKMKLHSTLDFFLHKTYHCNDTGKLSNKFNDWF